MWRHLPDGGVLYEFNISDVYSDGMLAYGEGSYSIVVDGEVIATGGDFGASATERFCAPAASCIQIVMVADNYPGEQSWSVTADGVEVLGAGLDGSTATYFLGECAPGCTDEAACNFDAEALVDDGSCLELDACGECGVPVWTPTVTACATPKKLPVAKTRRLQLQPCGHRPRSCQRTQHFVERRLLALGDLMDLER